MYSAAVLERVRNPERVGRLPEELGDVGTGQSGTLDAGIMTRIQIRVAAGRIVEARFKVFGCTAAIAASSLIAEWLEGATVEAARAFTAESVVAALELADDRAHVALVAVDAAMKALDDVTEKAGPHR